MFSDGFTDQLGGSKNTKFKFNRFQSLLLQNIDKPASEQKKVLNETFDLWKGKNKQLDDVVIIGMKI
jgi:serine phosphatase RsbU (regulator of sigma subunit)